LKTSSRVSYKLSSRRLSLLLFLLLWFAYGAAINSSNLLDFDLQHVGVEALVERGSIKLEAGDTAGARADWLQVLVRAPDGPAADAVRTRIELLEVHDR